MSLQVILAITLIAGCKGSEETHQCTSNFVIMTKEDLLEEIQSQITTTASTVTSVSTDICDFNVSRVTDELYTRIVELDTKKLVDLQEAINCPHETASSCKQILEKNPSSLSGYYWIQNSSTIAIKVYCDFTITAGGVTGGWMKVAELDMTNTNEECPGGFVARQYNETRLCVMNTHRKHCPVSLLYYTHGVCYNEIYGRIIGYQKGKTTGIHGRYNDIDGHYIDGVSLTHGLPGNRHHIWSFVAAPDENIGYGTCNCISGNPPDRNPKRNIPPNYVGLDYFCDTGSEQYREYYDDFTVFDDPLWDGAGCGPQNDCCTFNNPPWFYKKMTYNTTDDIEMRVCRYHTPAIHDVLIEKVDIYIR